MELFRRKIANLRTRAEAVANLLQQLPRQEPSTTSNFMSASPESTASAAAATATDASTTSTSLISAQSAAASKTPSLGVGGDHTVTVTASALPSFTATQSSAYIAPGINATDVKSGTSTYTAAEYLATANATAPGIPHNELTACRINGTHFNNVTNNGPFCSPMHEQNLWVGYTYAVTWNPTLFPNESDRMVVLRYTNDPQNTVWNSSVINGNGYVNVYMDNAFLLGASGNDTTLGQNMTFYIGSGQENDTIGPMISLTVDPSTLPPLLIPKLPGKYGLEIGLPIGFVAVLLIILAIWCSMRKHNRSWSIIRGHGNDYMSRRSRRRGNFGKEGGIQLGEYSSPHAQDAFSDAPYTGGSGNTFRDEVARQREEDDRSRTYVTSF